MTYDYYQTTPIFFTLIGGQYSIEFLCEGEGFYSNLFNLLRGVAIIQGAEGAPK